MNKFLTFTIISLCFFSSCKNKPNEQQTAPAFMPVENSSCDSACVETAYPPKANTVTTSPQTNPQPTRQNALKDAFEIGKSIGYQEAIEGVNNCNKIANGYSDDWVKQSFIQGYEMGRAEAISNGSAPDYEDEYDDGEAYYDDEY